jgi:F-type H+-transporting ATPase subunit b
MLIDWFTVVAQGINFLVLVWLLKRYLYKPVLAAIDAREKAIASTISDAASQRSGAEQERAAFAAKEATLDQESAAFLAQAKSAASAERARLMADAQTEGAALREKQAAALRDDQTRLRQEIANRTQQEVLAIVRKVLADLAGASLEERTLAVFVQRLSTLSASSRKILSEALAGAPEALVRSAFELSRGDQALVQGAISQEFAASTALHFEVSSEMLCGVELLVGGQKLAWNIADYLDGLEQKITPLRAVVPAPRPAMNAERAPAMAAP